MCDSAKGFAIQMRKRSVETIENNAGCYVLVLQLTRLTKVTYGRNHKRSFQFDAGWYVYVGSAMRGVRTRLMRHQRKTSDGKKLHWSIDYFREYAELHEVWYTFTEDPGLEHVWAQKFDSLPTFTIPIPGFGGSDCKSGCPAHFFRAPDRPVPAVLDCDPTVQSAVLVQGQ